MNIDVESLITFKKVTRCPFCNGELVYPFAGETKKFWYSTCINHHCINVMCTLDFYDINIYGEKFQLNQDLPSELWLRDYVKIGDKIKYYKENERYLVEILERS